MKHNLLYVCLFVFTPGHPWDSNETCSKVYLQGNHTYRLRSHSFECPRDTQSHDIQLPESYPRESYMSRARTYRDTSHETNTTGRPLTGKRHRFSCDATHEADTTGHPPTGKLLAEQSTASNKLPSQITAAFNEDCIIHPRDLKLYDEQLLGQGSYGQVLKARYRGTPCAAKRLHHIFRELLPGNRRMLENFIQECQKLSHIRHPKIVQFLGVQFDEETNVPLLVMERMECSLTSVLDSSQFLPMSTKLSIALDISQALAYLHSCDPPIVHRDLSSNNILLTANMEAKIADLGVSRYQTPADSGVQCTQCPGSLLYMAPEALTANPECNSAIDIFSYGVLLLQIITQNPPNPTPAGQEVDRRRNDLEQMQLELQEWGGLEDVRSLIYECLSNDPLKRPRALDICELLEKVQVSDPEREKPKLGLAKGNSLFSPISIILQPRPPLYSTQDPFPKSSTSQQCKVQSLVVPQQPQSQQHESSTQEANRQETTEQLLPGTIPVSTPYDDSSSEEQGASHAEQLSVESTPENESGTQEGEMVVCVHNRLHIVSRKQESSINNKASTVLSAIQTQSSDTECSAQAKREDSKMISDEESTGIPNQKASLQGAKSGSAESDVVHTATASSQVPKDSENQPNSKHRTTNIHPTNSLSNAHESPVFTLESSPHNGVQPSSHNTHSLEEDMTTTVLSGTFASNPDIHSPQKPDMWKLMPLTHRPYFLYCLQVSREEEMKWKYWNFSAFLNQSHFQTSLHHLVKRMNVLQWQFENGTPSIPRLQPSHTTRANSSQMVATEVPEPADVAVNEALRRSLILTGSLHALDLKHIAVFGALLAVDKRSLRLLLHAYVNSTLVCGYTASHMIVQKYAYKILDDDSQPSGFPPALPHSSTLTKIQSAHTTDQFKRLASCEPQQQSRLSSTQSPISQMLIIEVPESVDRGTEINSPESLILTTCKTKFDLAFTVADLLSNVLLRWLHNRPSMLQWPFENGTPSIPRLQSSYTTRANSSHVVAMEAPEPAVVVVNEALRKNLVLTGSLRALDHKHIAAFQINAYKILDDMQPPAPSGFPPALPNSLSANTTDQFKLHASYGSQQQSRLSRTIGQVFAMEILELAIHEASLIGPASTLNFTALLAYANNTLVCGYTASHMIVQKCVYNILDDETQPSGFPPALPHSSTLTKIQSAHTTDQFKLFASCEPQQQSSAQPPIGRMLIIKVPESVDRATEINSPERLILTTCKAKLDLAFTVADLLSNVLLRWLHNRPSMLQWPFENGTPSIPRLQSFHTTRANSSHVVAMEAPEPAVVVVNEALRKSLVLTGSLRALDHKHIAAFQINAYKILDDMQPPAPSGFPPALPNSLSGNTTDQFKLHASYGSQQQSRLSRTIGQVFAMEILELAIHEASLIGPASTLNFTALLAYANNTLVCGYTASHMIVQKCVYNILDDETQPSGFPQALPHSSTLTKIQSARTTDQFERFASFGPQQQSSAQPPIGRMLIIKVPESVDRATEINSPESLILTTCKTKFDLAFTVADILSNVLLRWLHNRPFMLQWPFENGTPSIPRLQSFHTTRANSSHVVAMEAPEPAVVVVNEALRKSLVLTGSLRALDHKHIAAFQINAYKILDDMQPPAPSGFPPALPNSLSANTTDQFKLHASYGSQQQSGLSRTIGQVFAMEILELAIHEASLIGPASTLNFTALLAYANNTLVCGYTASHMIVQKYAYKILDDDTQPSGFPPALPHSSTLTKIQSAHTTDQFKRFASFGPQQQSSAQPPIVQMLTVEVPESVDKTTEINCPESLILTTCKAKPYGKILLGSLHNRPFMLQWRFKNGTSSIPRLQSPHTTCTSSSHVVAMEAPEPADVTVNEAFRRSLIVHLVSLHTFALHYTTSQSIVQKYAIKFLDNTQCGFPKALPHSLSLKKLQSASLSDQFTKLCRASRGSQQQSNLSGTLSPNSEKISPEAQSTALSMKDSKTMLPTQAEVETETTLCISEDHICNHVGTGNTMCQSQLIPYYADSFWINACYLTNLCTLPCAVGMQLSKYPYLELNSQSTTPEKPFYTLPNPSNDSGVQRKDAYLPEHSTSQTHSLPREVGPRDGQAMKLQFRGQLAKTSCLETDSNFWFHLWKLMPLRHRPFFLYCLQVSREEEMKWKCWNMVIVRPHQTFTTNHSLIAFSAFLNQSSLHHLVKRMNVLQWQFENGTPIESTDIAVNEVLRLILIGLVQIAAFTAIGKRLKSIVFQQHDYVVYVYFQFLSRSQYISVLLKYATPFLVDSLPLCNNTNHVLGAIEPQDSSCAAVKQPWSTVTKHSKSQTALITTTFTRPMSMVSSNGNCQYWNLKYLLQSLSRFQNCNDNIRGYTALKHATKFLTLPTAFPLSFGQRTSLQSASVKDQIKVLINLCTSLGGLCMQTGNYPYMSTYYYTTPEKPFYTLPNQSNDSGVQHKDAYLSEQSTSQTHSLRLCPDPREVDPRDDKALTTDAIMETTSTNFKPHKLLSVYKSMTPDTHRNTHYHCIIMEHLSQGNSFCLLLQLSYDIHNVVNGGGILAVINIIPNSSPNSKSLTAFVMATLFNNSQTQRSSLILCDHNHRHMLDRHGEQQDSSIYISASVPPKWLASLVSQRGIQQLPYSSPWSKHSLMQPCQNKETFLILQNSLIVDNPEIATLIKPNESLNVRHSFSPVLSCSKSSTQTICSYLPPPLIPPMGKIRPSIKGIKITTCPGNSNGGQSGSGSGTGSTGSSSGGSSGNVPAPGGGAGGVGGSSCGGGAGGGDNGDKDDKDKDKNPPWDPDKGEEEEISPSVEEIVTPSSSNTLKDDDTVTETRDPSNLPPDSESEDEEHQHQTHFHIKDHGGKPATKGDVEGEDSTNDKRVPAADQLGKTANSDSHEQSTLPQNPHDGLEGMHTDQHGGSNCDMSDSQSSTDTAELTLESSASPAGPEGNSLAVNQNLPLPLPPPVHQHNHKHPSQHSFLSVANGDDNDSASSTDMFQNAQAEDSCQGIHNEVLVTGLSHHSYSPFHADVDLAESDDYIPSTPMAPQPFQSLAGCEADIQSNNESPTTQKYSSATVGVTVGDLTNVTTPLPETSSQPAQQLVSGLSSSWCTVQNVEV